MGLLSLQKRTLESTYTFKASILFPVFFASFFLNINLLKTEEKENKRVFVVMGFRFNYLV